MHACRINVKMRKIDKRFLSEVYRKKYLKFLFKYNRLTAGQSNLRRYGYKPFLPSTPIIITLDTVVVSFLYSFLNRASQPHLSLELIN